MLSYVWHDLTRNPRRTIASVLGVTLGVGLFSGVLFFIDGSAASMTKRAIAPLTMDMQRVLTSPLGRGLRMDERIASSDPLPEGQDATITLTVVNDSEQTANEVVVHDETPPPLSYVADSATRDGQRVGDVDGGNPFAQGAAGTGLNLGPVGPRTTVTLTYAARASRTVPASTLVPGGRISSREDVVPTAANAPAPLGLDELRTRIARIPGVVAADGLSFVDLPPASLRAGPVTLSGPVRVFAFDRAYQRHYPSISVVAGGFDSRSAMLSAEASRALGAARGSVVELVVPGRSAPLALPVGGITDLTRARPLFSSRKTSKFEDFLYVPNSMVVSPETFAGTIIPGFQAAVAVLGSQPRSLPVLEVDVKVDRSRLHSDPGRALAQTTTVARSVSRIQPDQNYLIDNISNTLEVARDDAIVGKRMFVFLGLPGVLLAAFLSAYAGVVLAAAQRREQAMLRIRGADRGHLRRMLAYKTIAFAGVGSVLGVTFGFLSVIAIIGGHTLFEASPGALVVSGLVAAGVGIVTTAVAQYIPGRRSVSREISQERREITANPPPAWRRWRLDFALLGVAAIAELVALRAGAFDAVSTSVSAGQSVSLPSYLMLAPMVAWLGGMLLAVRAFETVTARLAIPEPPRFGPVLRGTLRRSLRRRSWAFATGIVGVGLVIAFGIGIAMFAATYEHAKGTDSEFVVGSELRITPSVLNPRPKSAQFASRLRVRGVAGVTPLVFKLENAVLVGRYNQDRKDLAAIDPAGFERVAAPSDSFFVDQSAARAMAAMRTDRRALLVDEDTADEFAVAVGDRVRVLLARGSRQQTLRTFHVVGRFRRFPGFPQGVHLVANLAYYEASTRSADVDFFLASTTDRSHQGLARAVAALHSGPGRNGALNIETRETALDKDQSSLTALNVRGLVDLDSLYTLLMSAAAIGIFVFGLLLQRRREYVTLRAQGMRTSQVRSLVLGEAALVVVCGSVAGLLVGGGMAALLVYVLRPLFILDPRLTLPTGDLARLALLATAATLASALAASAILNRLEPNELLRDT